MPQAGPVPLPRGKAPSPQGYHLGGQNGTIAEPSREAGYGTVDRPALAVPRGGQHGVVQLFRPLTGPDAYRLPHYPMPPGYASTFYIRRFFPNLWPFLSMVVPRRHIDWTTNTTDNPPGPGAPVPLSSRFRVLSYRQTFNQRVWAPYMPPEQFQRPTYTRRPLAGGDPPNMIGGYISRLTQWAANRSFGSQTALLPGGGGPGG